MGTGNRTALVTGATGFVGSHVARLLLEEGYSIRCLIRDGSDKRNLPEESETVSWVTGDLLDPLSLVRALDGMQELYHVAADYRLWTPRKGEIIQTNVEGTRNMLEACRICRPERIVYCSSVAALGTRTDGVPINETMEVDTKTLIGEYKLSKYLSEQLVLSYAGGHDGGVSLPIVIVNPSAPIGERDIKPTPTGRIVRDYMRKMMKAYVRTGLNVIHVRDVARGHLLAAQKGIPGQKYILANQNMQLIEIFHLLAKITGVPAPKAEMPRSLLFPVAVVSEGISLLTGREPLVPFDAARMAHKMMFFSGDRAVRELGLVLTPVEKAFEDAVVWFSKEEYMGAGTFPGSVG
jgi:dihydroflavonol-4-reductase